MSGKFVLPMIVLGLAIGFLINDHEPAPRKRHAGKVLENITQISQKFDSGEASLALQNRARRLGMDLVFTGESHKPSGYTVSFVLSDAERIMVATVNKLAALPGEVSVDGVRVTSTTNVYSLIKAKTRDKTDINVKVTRNPDL
ncbi:MAG: hypothetical protein RSD49_06495 [Hafnia sp.]